MKQLELPKAIALAVKMIMMMTMMVIPSMFLHLEESLVNYFPSCFYFYALGV